MAAMSTGLLPDGCGGNRRGRGGPPRLSIMLSRDLDGGREAGVGVPPSVAVVIAPP